MTKPTKRVSSHSEASTPSGDITKGIFSDKHTILTAPHALFISKEATDNIEILIIDLYMKIWFKCVEFKAVCGNKWRVQLIIEVRAEDFQLLSWLKLSLHANDSAADCLRSG